MMADNMNDTDIKPGENANEDADAEKNSEGADGADDSSDPKDKGDDAEKGGDDKSSDKSDKDKKDDKKSDKGDDADDDDADKDKDKGDKADDDDDADKDKEGDDADEDDGAPENYEDFTTPEGTEINDELLTSYKEFGKTNNLSQKAAQEGVDLFAGAMETFVEEQANQWVEVKKEWAKETNADKEMQGEDGTAKESIAVAVKAVNHLGGQELKDAFDLTGAGDHPVVVKVFHQLGMLLGEDAMIFGGDKGDTRTMAEKMFPDMDK